MSDPEIHHRAVESLLEWFDSRNRDVPSRGSEDPYVILVAEIMAQQTRIATVRPYFRKFLELFPTVEALADAEIDQVLKAWEGLGYYARAENLTLKNRKRGTSKTQPENSSPYLHIILER